MSVSFLDLARLHRSIERELSAAYRDALERSAFVGAGACVEFEEAFAGAHNAKAAAGCGSGTDALALALRALGVGAGDEVIVPSLTFVATAEAVVHVGATPVLADVDAETLLISPSSVRMVRTERTRAVIPVHLYGHVVPAAHLKEWSQSGLIVIEDAAQAHLATDEGDFVGTWSDAACFSFYPGKNLGALGDGGAVVSRDMACIEEVAKLRDHGRTTKYEHDTIGWCSRLDGLQAAFLTAKLRHLPDWTAGRRAHAQAYRVGLSDLLVPWESGAVHHLLVMRTRSRSVVQAALDSRGVETGVHYPVPLSRQPSLKRWSVATPAAEQAAREVISLPMDPLMTEGDVMEVIDAVRSVIPS